MAVTNAKIDELGEEVLNERSEFINLPPPEIQIARFCMPAVNLMYNSVFVMIIMNDSKRQNKYGIARDMSESVKRQVRQNSKFGCIFCRCALYEYHHIEEYSGLKVDHDPSKICLLCPTCHTKCTKKLYAVETVADKYVEVQTSDLVRSPGETFEYQLDSTSLRVVLGTAVFESPRIVIEIDGETILAIDPPEEGSRIPVLTGYFTDQSGKKIFSVEKNEWTLPSLSWDVETVGRKLIIRQGKRNIALKLIVNAPNEIVIEKLNMFVGTCHIKLDHNLLSVGRITNDAEYYLSIIKLVCQHANVGVRVESKIFSSQSFTPEGLSILGGSGIDFIGTGIKLAVGSGSYWVSGVEIIESTRKFTRITTFPLTTDLSGKVKYRPIIPRLR